MLVHLLALLIAVDVIAGNCAISSIDRSPNLESHGILFESLISISLENAVVSVGRAFVYTFQVYSCVPTEPVRRQCCILFTSEMNANCVLRALFVFYDR